MADEADRADEIIEAATQAAIDRARQGPFHSMRPTGFCHWCGDPVSGERLHCSPVENDCADVHLKHIRFNRENP